MARRPLSGVAGLLIALAVTACTSSGGTATTSFGAASSTSTFPSTTSTTSTSTTTTTIAPTTTTTFDHSAIDALVTVPEGDGPFPAVVLAHGGSWVAGGPSLMEPLASHLNDNGFLTVNTSYTLASFDGPGFPFAVEDVACAVRYAAAHPDSDGRVAIVGHSAGAHIGAVVSLTGDDYDTGCTIEGSGVPEGFVGLAGPYNIARMRIALIPFFGDAPGSLPEAWEAGNPQLLVDENTSLESLIMYGEMDGFVPESFAIDFHDALTAAGSESVLEEIGNARHNDMHDPDLVGDLIVNWLER